MTHIAQPSRSLRYHASPETSPQTRRLHLASALRLAHTADGRSLEALSREAPLLVVFLRPLGDPFCRQALDDLALQRAAIEARGARVVLVHLADEARSARVFAEHGLDDLPRVSDPEAAIYAAFGLDRGGPLELFGPRVVWRALGALLQGRVRFGALDGDPLRMPGVFVVHQEVVVRTHRPADVAERVDYVGLVEGVHPFAEAAAAGRAP